MAVTDRAGIVDTHAAAVALQHADSGSLTTFYQTEIYCSAAIGIDTTTAHGSDTALYYTIAQRCAIYHIHTASVGCMLACLCIACRSRAAGDHTSVQRRRTCQSAVVSLGTVVAGFIHSIRSEPHYVVRTGRIGRVVAPANTIEYKCRRRRGVVSREHCLVAQIPLRGDLRAGGGTYTRGIGPVLAAFFAVGHNTVTRFLLRIVGIKTAVHMDTGVDLKRSIQHRATCRLCGFGWHIVTGSYIDRSGFHTRVGKQIVAQVVDSVLHLILCGCPALTIVIERTAFVARAHVPNGIRLRLRICACAYHR